jgi:hypothetical protein
MDQPWLDTVTDGVMQLSMWPKFGDKVVLTKAGCAGSRPALFDNEFCGNAVGPSQSILLSTPRSLLLEPAVWIPTTSESFTALKDRFQPGSE